MNDIIIGTEQNGVLKGNPPLIVQNGQQSEAKLVSQKTNSCEQDTDAPSGSVDNH